MQENLKTHDVIFVLGVHHSGTTILYRLLGRHPDLGWFSQFSQRGGTVPDRFPLPFWGLYNRLGRRIFDVPWKKKRDFTEYFIPRPMEANRIWEYLVPPSQESYFYDSTDIDDDMNDRFKTVFNAEFSKWNTNRLVCKLPRLTRAMIVLNEIIPVSKFVYLVRDGRAVAMSNRHKHTCPEKSELETLEDSAMEWKRIVEWVEAEARPAIPSEQIMTVRLIDFLSKPHEYFSDILDFCDLSDERYPFPLPELKSNTNKKWRERASSQEKKLLNDVLNKPLSDLGYTSEW